MAQYDNTNKGALWKVEERKTEKHPHFTGKLNVEGREYSVAAWTTREPQGRQPHIRLSVTPKEDHVGDHVPQEYDDIPF